MKRNFLILFSLVATVLVGCEADDTADVVINDNSVTNITNNNGGSNDDDDDIVYLSGVYTQDLSLDANIHYIVNGPVLMVAGTTLTVPAGMTVKAAPVGVNATLLFSRELELLQMVLPIIQLFLVLNAATPSTGDWGGLVICGNASINSTGWVL